MPRAKLILAGLIVVMAVSVAASAPASAAPSWKLESSQLTGTEAVSEKGDTSSILKAVVGGAQLVILCDGSATTGLALAGTKGFSEPLRFTECSVTTPVGCKPSTATLTTTQMTSELIEEAGEVYDKFTPVGGTEFIRVNVEGCAAEGSYKITGTARGLAGTQEAVEGPLEFTSETGSSLKFGPNPATFTATCLATLSGKNKGKVWSA